MKNLVKIPKLVALFAFFLGELVISSMRIAWDVLTPRAYRAPGIVAVPLDAQSDTEIATVANLISLTPGSLSVDVSSDRRTLYVHSMFAGDPDELRMEIKNGFERRVLEILR